MEKTDAGEDASYVIVVGQLLKQSLSTRTVLKLDFKILIKKHDFWIIDHIHNKNDH